MYSGLCDTVTCIFVNIGGFYTDIIRPGLRVVSLNNNYCSTDDWWLLVGNNSVDPVGQLSWFASVMQEVL